MLIRKEESKDCDIIYSVVKAAFDSAEHADRFSIGFAFCSARISEKRDRNVFSIPSLIVGVLFGLTDYAYWLYVTDLGVDRDYAGRGIGRQLMKTVHDKAGGEKGR